MSSAPGESIQTGHREISQRTEKSAKAAGDTLESIEGRSKILVESSSRIQDSLMAVNVQTEKLAEALGDVEAQISDVMRQPLLIF